MTNDYDPLVSPDPLVWQALSEDEQLRVVLAYHRATGAAPPNPRAHAALHVVVENQIALGQVIPVAATLVRLQNGGLDRHEAVHAIASVLADHMTDLLAAAQVQEDPSRAYYDRLGTLTAGTWRLQSE